MAERPIAEHTDAANEQHYEVPAAFFQACLGPRLKYSSCLYEPGDTLAPGRGPRAGRDLRPRRPEGRPDASWSSAAAGARCRCGWPRAYPNVADHLGLQLRQPGRLHPRPRRRRGPDQPHRHHRRHERLRPAATPARTTAWSRVEMFEHMANWRALLGRVKTWLKPDGRLFIHIFTHKTGALPLRRRGRGRLDRPALLRRRRHAQPQPDAASSPTSSTVEEDWRWSGDPLREDRARTGWRTTTATSPTIRPVLRQVYGDKAVLWHRRWRLFFLATAGLFGHRGGEEWGVSHYRLKPA